MTLYQINESEMVKDFFRSNGNVISDGAEEYMFMPYWIFKNEKGFYFLTSYADLPKHIQQLCESTPITTVGSAWITENKEK